MKSSENKKVRQKQSTAIFLKFTDSSTAFAFPLAGPSVPVLSTIN